MRFVSFNRMHSDIVHWMHVLPRDIGFIIGIPRSGMLMGSMIGLYRNIPVISLDEFCGGLYRPVGERSYGFGYQASAGKKVLLIDDSVYTGDTMKEARRRALATIAEGGSKFELVTAAAYVTASSGKRVNHFCRIVEAPRCFEWNLFHKPFINRVCMDIDGVLTIDCTPEQSADPILYNQYLKTARPKYIPTVKIGALVTSRLEADRRLTVQWLKRHNVKYGELIMSPHKTPAMRRRAKDHAIRKAQAMQKTEFSLFIESSRWQAATISKLTKRHAICTDDMTLFTNGRLVCEM